MVCYCCGKKGHKSLDCKDKDKIPKEKWFQNKAYQNYMKKMRGDNNDDNSSAESEAPSNMDSRSG